MKATIGSAVAGLGFPMSGWSGSKQPMPPGMRRTSRSGAMSKVWVGTNCCAVVKAGMDGMG